MPDSALTELLTGYVSKLIQEQVKQNPVHIVSPLAEEGKARVECAIKIGERLMNYPAKAASRYLRFILGVCGKTISAANHLTQPGDIITGPSQ